MGLLDSLGGLIDSLLNTDRGGQQPSVTPITPQKPAVQRKQKNTEPAQDAAAQKPESKGGTVPPDEIYMPSTPAYFREEVENVVLTDAEASAAGWHYRRKSRRRVRITGYTGKEQDVTVPAEIGGCIVNEIGKSAFSRIRITGIRIPATMKKLGEGCLSMNAVEEIVFDYRCVLDIPARFAKRCRHLSAVKLPEREVKTMGNEAFAGCTALQEIDLKLCRKVGAMAFAESGLKAFRMERNFYTEPDGTHYTEFDGTALMNTPIDQKYSIIARRLSASEALSVLMFGQKGSAARLPAEKVTVEHHAVLDRPDRLMILDFSLCTEVHFSDSAFCCTYYANNGRTTRQCKTTVILPENHDNPYIPECVNVQTAGSKPYSGFLTRKPDAPDSYEPHADIYPFRHRRVLPYMGVRIPEKRLIIQCYDLFYRKEAICSPTLEEVTLQRLCGVGELCDRCCRRLHFVEINKQQLYLPSADLVGEDIHTLMLKAICGKMRYGEYIFFDTAIIDRLFRGELLMKKYARTQLHLIPWRILDLPSPYYRELTQRQKILIAADVMRSTPELFPNRKMYAEYLRAHRRYAHLLCYTLPEDYAAYLAQV